MDALTPVSPLSKAATQPANSTPASDTRATDGAFDGAIKAQAAAPLGGASSAPEAQSSGWKQLETLLVQNMLQSVMTSEEGGFFGEGLGSEYYQSFLVEQFAARLSDGLDLGIASRLDRHYGSGDHA